MTFFLTIVFMFMVFWRPQEWLFPWLYGLPLLDAVVVLALAALLLEADSGRVKLPKRSPQLYLLVGLWVAAMASQAVHTYFAGMQMAATEVFKICFFTFLLYCVTDSPAKLRTGARIFVLTAVIMAVHAIMQEKTGRGFKGQWPLWIPAIGDNPPHTRSVFFGIFSDPNDLAQVLATAVPLCFVLTKRQTPISFGLGGALAALLIRAYMTTHSRGGAVALVAVAAVMLCLFLPQRWTPYWVGAGLVAVLVLCRLQGGALLDMSARERVVFWGYGNQAFKSNPIFGIGYNMYWQIASGRSAHNAFVTCYTELGLLGYWMWFSFLVLGVIGAWRVRVRFRHEADPEMRFLNRFSGQALAALAGFSASAYFLSRTFVYPMFFLMAIINAVPRIGDLQLADDDEPLQKPRRDLGVIATVATLGSIVFIYLSIILLNRAYFS